jgi:hypothetical protein
MKRYLILVLSVIITLSSLASKAYADSSSLRISPVKSQISVAQSKSQNITVYVQNITTTSKTVSVDFRDTVVDGTGTRTLAPQGQLSSSDGTTAYMSGPSSFVIAANETKSYAATITVPADAEQKTRYGGMAFTVSGDTGSVASLLVATITANPVASSSAPQSSQSSSATSSTTPQPTTSSSSSSGQPTATNDVAKSTSKKLADTQQKDKTIAAHTVSKTKKSALWAGIAVVAVLIAVGGIFLWRRKKVTSVISAVTPPTVVASQIHPETVNPTVQPANPSGQPNQEYQQPEPETQSPDQNV